jgi:tetratricopeptide (TPR) repeat protein
MNGDSGSVVVYLKHIWGTPLFNLEVNTYTESGREDIIAKWSKIQQENIHRIQSLESATHLYPYSPELYYNLSLLYAENGDQKNAKLNLQKARQIDPSI